MPGARDVTPGGARDVTPGGAPPVIPRAAPPGDPRAAPPAVPRPAATVVLVRPAARGAPGGRAPCEVYLQKRAGTLRFAAGFHVFPGGALDAGDGAPGARALLAGEGGWGRGEPALTAAHVVAAVRECYEEAGVLLARAAEGRAAHADPARAARLAGARSALEAKDGAAAFVAILRREGLRLDGGALRYLAHWVTPAASPIRFDTRFFLARLPEGAAPTPCSGESVEGGWWRPGAALAAFEGGWMRLLPPTEVTLRFLAQFDSFEELWTACDDGAVKIEGTTG